MKAFVYVGGGIYPDGFIPEPRSRDLTVAADSGIHTAERCGVRPMLCVGDFDSHSVPEGIEVLRLPAEKDDTDGQHAVREAILRGADEVVIIGGLGGRVDHTLSCLAILEECSERGISAAVTDGRCRVRFLKNGSMTLYKEGFRYFSLITLEKEARGVTLSGCKYPLHDAEIRRSNQFAVSNEITEEKAVVTTADGTVYVIESNDA